MPPRWRVKSRRFWLVECVEETGKSYWILVWKPQVIWTIGKCRLRFSVSRWLLRAAVEWFELVVSLVHANALNSWINPTAESRHWSVSLFVTLIISKRESSLHQELPADCPHPLPFPRASSKIDIWDGNWRSGTHYLHLVWNWSC